MKKRIQFTTAELNLINKMAAIASVSNWRDGAYAGFSGKSEAFHSLREKVWALLDRKEAKV